MRGVFSLISHMSAEPITTNDGENAIKTSRASVFWWGFRSQGRGGLLKISCVIGSLVCSGLLSACDLHPKHDSSGVVASDRDGTQEIQEYRIGPEDVLDIVVWKNADLSKTVTVRPDGMITLPLIGEIRAGDRTANELRDDIKVRLERYKDVPEVSVTIADVRSYHLYILGEVKTPGQYQVKTTTTLLQALALAGGLTEFADSNDIVVVRRGGSSQEQRIKVRYKDLILRGDVTLSPGDTVTVR